MKPIRNFTFIACTSLVCSCALFKHKTSEYAQKEVHHYHDSTINNYTEKIIETKIKGDSNQTTYNLEELIKKGMLSQQNGLWRQNIELKNGLIYLTTKVDSLQKITRTVDNESHQKIVNKADKAIVEHKTKVVKIQDFTMLGICLVIITVVFILAFFVYKYFKTQRILI